MTYKKLFLDNERYITYKSITNNADDSRILVYFHGFYSSIESTKCKMFEDFCAKNSINFLAFDYLGHGKSSGNVEDFVITDWISSAKKLMNECCNGKKMIFVGSSVGGFLSCLLSLEYKDKVVGVLGMSAAIDFLTESVEPHVKKEDFEKDIILKIPNKNGEFINNITRKLWLDGEKYSLLTSDSISISCPLRFVHGMADNLIDYKIILKFMEKVETKNVKLTLIKDANHYMTREEDIETIFKNLKEILELV